MKILQVAKTKVGVVKYPPKMADNVFNLVLSEVLSQLNYSARSQHSKTAILAVAKSEGVPVIKRTPSKRKIFTVDANWEGLPESYWNYQLQPKRGWDKDSFIFKGTLDVIVDWSKIDKDVSQWSPEATRNKDAGGTFSLPESGGSDNHKLGTLTVFPSLVDFINKDIYISKMQNVLPRDINSLRFTLDSLVGNLQEVVWHELSHMVQFVFLPSEQTEQREGRPTDKDNYYTSPIEFGPLLRSVGAKLFSDAIYYFRTEKADTWDGKPYSEKVSDESILEEIKFYTDESKPKGNLNFVISPEPFFVALKKYKPTAYKKAVKYIHNIVEPRIMKVHDKLKTQKTSQVRR